MSKATIIILNSRKFTLQEAVLHPRTGSVSQKKNLDSYQCCGSGMFIPDPGSEFFPSRIPDPNCLHPGSRILIKEFKYFNPKKGKKKWFLSSKKYDPGCSSRIPDPDADFLPSRIPGSKRHPIPDPGSGSATLIPTVLRVLYDLLSMKYDVNSPSKSNKLKNLDK
jgi:hypothetical protein